MLLLILDLNWAEIDTLYVIVPESKFVNADPTLIPEATAHAVNVRSDVLKIELVGEEEGNAGYSDPPYGDDMIG